MVSQIEQELLRLRTAIVTSSVNGNEMVSIIASLEELMNLIQQRNEVLKAEALNSFQKLPDKFESDEDLREAAKVVERFFEASKSYVTVIAEWTLLFMKIQAKYQKLSGSTLEGIDVGGPIYD